MLNGFFHIAFETSSLPKLWLKIIAFFAPVQRCQVLRLYLCKMVDTPMRLAFCQTWLIFCQTKLSLSP